MRFDDSLDTVLAADMSSPAAVQWTWRQVVDLIGRGRVGARADAIARLRAIRDAVPHDVRVAAARGLERADPPAALVALFSDEDIAVAAPVVRSARLTADEWIALLPDMRPAARGILRLRRDLPGDVMAALEAFGSTDFALGGVEAIIPEHTAPEPVADVAASFIPPEADPFVALADVARELPAVAEAIRLEEAEPLPKSSDFEIASLVARIEAHQRTAADRPAIIPPPTTTAPDTFRFETDARGLIRWVEGIERAALIGLSLTAGRDGAPVSVDGVAAGALARRARFADARLEVGGTSAASGSWRISGVPAFDYASGRFTGYRGTARRPRRDEAPDQRVVSPASDALRQLVHELRTPANAISGFAEMIEHQLLGPVPPAYREQAATIRGQTLGLLDAIDDLDTAARLESKRLELRAEPVELAPLLARVVDDLAPLARLRGTALTFDAASEVTVTGDLRAIERLLSRFLTAVVSSAAGEPAIRGKVSRDGAAVALTMDRPRAFVAAEGALFGGDAELDAVGEGGPLLGAAFAFRLARRLAAESGGGVTVTPTALVLRLPAATDLAEEQVTV